MSEDALTDSTPLWRYMKLSSLLMLLEGEAFFPSVKTLRSADRLEGQLYADAPWLIGKLHSLKGDTEVDTLVKWLKSQLDAVQLETLERNSQDPAHYGRQLAYLYVRELAARRAVWCWFKSTDESSAMWSIYGHYGVAVGTTFRKLRDALPPSRKFHIADIRYAKKDGNGPHRFNPEAEEDLIHRPHLLKGIEYQHEHELRVVTFCSPHETGALVHGIQANALIDHIVISPLLPFGEAKAVEHCLKRHEWSSVPEIHRSELLGEFVDAEELAAVIEEKFNVSEKVLGEEPNLPPLMREL